MRRWRRPGKRMRRCARRWRRRWAGGEGGGVRGGGWGRGEGGWEAAARWLVDHYGAEPEAAAAVAVPYLKLFGTVAGGWLMARAALVARERAGAPGADREL